MSSDLRFTPVLVRARRDGWTPAIQAAFIAALARTRSVVAACRAVGRSWQTAYRLRARAGAAGFAAAWDSALAGPDLDRPVTGRALGGVATPIRYRGRQVGERRRYDNRLGMWILARRQPERYGDWRSRTPAARGNPDGGAWLMGQAIGRVAAEGQAVAQGRPRPRWAPLKTAAFADDPEQIEAEQALAERREAAQREAEWQAYLETANMQMEGLGGGGSADDAA